jgi:catechol-2,3-dioxygenase
MDDLRRLYGMLLRKNVPIVKITDHKVGYGLYFTDPDGHRFEFFLETIHDDEEGRRVLGEHNAPSDPFDLQPL